MKIVWFSRKSKYTVEDINILGQLSQKSKMFKIIKLTFQLISLVFLFLLIVGFAILEISDLRFRKAITDQKGSLIFDYSLG